MKICPLVTQAYILEEQENELLVMETDDHELSPEETGEGPDESGEDIFMNPESGEESDSDSPEDTNDPDESEVITETPVRFTAKSFKGEVKCLGSTCRFHDDNAKQCRFEMFFASTGKDTEDDGKISEEIASIDEKLSDRIGSVTDKLDKTWDFQQQSASDMLGFFKEIQEKNEKRQNEIAETMGDRFTDLKKTLDSITEDNRMVIESIADTLAEKTEDIEGQIKSSEDSIQEFKSEVSDWKGSLDQSIDSMQNNLGESRKMVEELSENHNEMMQVVENQKKSLEEEEKKRMLSEAKKLNNAGVMSYHNGQYEKALEMFKNAIDLDEDFTEAYNNMGLTYTEMNDEDKATEAFKKAIELNPDLGATYNNLGYVFYRLGSYVEAIEMYNEAIGRSKDNSSAWTNLGNAYYKLDRIEEALEAWNKAVEIDPGNEKAKRNLKRFHAEAGEPN
ncbi:MAG: tetratricopeptide repeat protein [Bacteroidales bacterium]|nr:tetratricopeptide repeat protein [Candidatus Latescibacterota bacterium]